MYIFRPHLWEIHYLSDKVNPFRGGLMAVNFIGDKAHYHRNTGHAKRSNKPTFSFCGVWDEKRWADSE